MGESRSNPYLEHAVMTASSEQLQLMLYDGAIRFAMQGKDALERKDYETSYNKLSRAQAIVQEMEVGLRPEVNPELCDRMASIYRFLYLKLVDASVSKSTEAIDDALKVLRIERETWAMLVDKVNTEREQEAVAAAADGGPADRFTFEESDEPSIAAFSFEG